MELKSAQNTDFRYKTTVIPLYQNDGYYLAEMEGFEPPHALRRLADFESAPFSHLGTSPEQWLLYQPQGEKSRFFRQFHYLRHLLHHSIVVFPFVGPQAAGAVLDAGFGVGKLAAAPIPKGIQRAVAEQAAEAIRIRALMAGKVLALLMLKKIVICHFVYLLHCKKQASLL